MVIRGSELRKSTYTSRSTPLEVPTMPSAHEKTTLKYPLSAPLKVGIENLKRLNLNVEAGTTLNLEELKPLHFRITLLFIF